MLIFKKNSRSWFIVLLVFFMAASIFLLPQFLSLSLTLFKKPPISAGGANSSLGLPDSLNVQTSSEFSLPVNIDTDNASIQRADVQIKFDKDILTFININPSAENNTNLKIFSPEKNNLIKQANHTGFISFSFSASSSTSMFNGQAILAVLTFQPKKTGTTGLTFVKSGIFTDPVTNILSKTINSTITIAKNNSGLSARQFNSPVKLMGDLNNDGVIDNKDLAILMQDFGKTGAPGFIPSDLNNDGKIDIFDRNLLQQNFSKQK